MSDRPIAVGDLVQVVRWPCCDFHVGAIRTVEGFVHFETAHCAICGASGPSSNANLSGDGRAPVAWLKRIPPLSELEGMRTEETTKEPA